MLRLPYKFHCTWTVKSLLFEGKCFCNITINNYCLRPQLNHVNILRTTRTPFSMLAANEQERLQTVKLAFDFYEPTKDAAFSSLPIVIMHGLLGSKANWKSLCKVIVQRTSQKIYALDARNHGESPHSENFNYYYMAADIEDFLREKRIDKAILVGHSMGGRSAMIVALNKPELVEKLVLVDISPVSTPDAINTDIPRYMEAMLSSLKEIPAGTSLSQARHLVNKHLSSAVPNIVIRQFLLTNLIQSNKEIKWRYNLEVLQRNFKEGIREFPFISGKCEKETLFICGSESHYVPKSDHEKIRKIFCNSRFEYVEGANHWVHAEKPTEFTRILIEFIQS